MNKKKTSTNIQSINKSSFTKKRNYDTNNPSTDNSIDDSSKLSEKSQNKRSSKTNTNTNYSSLNINAPPYKSYRKHIDRKKNTNLYKNLRGNDKINTSYTNKNNQSNTNNNKRNETPKKTKKILWKQNITSSSVIIKGLMDKYNVNLIQLKKYAFDKISSLSKDIIFQNLLTIKKQINNLLDIINKQNK